MTKTELINLVGSGNELARLAGVTKQAVSQWNEQIPPLRAVAIEIATRGQITAHSIRPDYFPASFKFSSKRRKTIQAA